MDFLTIMIIVVIIAAVCTMVAGTWLLIQRHREDRAAKARGRCVYDRAQGRYMFPGRKNGKSSAPFRHARRRCAPRRSCGRSSKKGGRYLI
jgi:hypothetical protein